MGRYTSGGVGRDILAGAIAGAAAIWVADKLDQAIYRAGGPDGVRRTEAARPGGMDPAHVLAKRAADAAGVDVGDPKDNPAGHAIHYGIAAGMGALYGLLRGMTPGVSTGRGALFGIAAFILQDEIGNTVLGTAGNPLSYPIRDHARGAAAHTLFGIVTDLGTRLMSPWRDEVVIEQGASIVGALGPQPRVCRTGAQLPVRAGAPWTGAGARVSRSGDQLCEPGRPAGARPLARGGRRRRRPPRRPLRRAGNDRHAVADARRRSVRGPPRRAAVAPVASRTTRARMCQRSKGPASRAR